MPAARPNLKFTGFDDLIADAEKLRAGRYDQAGKWDLPMILDHLAKAMALPFTPGRSLPWPLSGVASVILHQIANRETYPGVMMHAPKFLRPTQGIALETAYQEFASSANRLNGASGETIVVPPAGRVKLDDFKKLQLLHGAHHLGFLKQAGA